MWKSLLSTKTCPLLTPNYHEWNILLINPFFFPISNKICLIFKTVPWTLNITNLLFVLDTMSYELCSALVEKMLSHFDLFPSWVCGVVIYQVGVWSWKGIWELRPYYKHQWAEIFSIGWSKHGAPIEWEQISKAYCIHFVWLVVWHFQITHNDLGWLAGEHSGPLLPQVSVESKRS